MLDKCWANDVVFAALKLCSCSTVNIDINIHRRKGVHEICHRFWWKRAHVPDLIPYTVYIPALPTYIYRICTYSIVLNTVSMKRSCLLLYLIAITLRLQSSWILLTTVQLCFLHFHNSIYLICRFNLLGDLLLLYLFSLNGAHYHKKYSFSKSNIEIAN